MLYLLEQEKSKQMHDSNKITKPTSANSKEEGSKYL